MISWIGRPHLNRPRQDVSSARRISAANAYSRLLGPSSRRTLSNSFTKPFTGSTPNSGTACEAYCLILVRGRISALSRLSGGNNPDRVRGLS
jgi:hypothetical protein